jgi:NADH-quinone oxidoreductase subunit A
VIQQLGPVLVLAAVVIGFAFVSIFLTGLAGPKKKSSPEKSMPYECGIPGVENRPSQFSVKFYLTAILFILFDIEVIFLYPWALVYNDMLKLGPFIFLEMMVFLFILTFGLFYVWKGRALEWD